MDLRTLISLTIKVSVLLVMFGLGLAASLKDALSLFRRPEALGRSLLAMNIVMPLVAVLLVAAFKLRPEVALGLVALSVSPIPPTVPIKHLWVGGSAAYMLGLLVAASLLAIVLAPATLEVFSRIFEKSMRVPVSTLAEAIGVTVLAPLAAGMLVRRLAPAFAERIAWRVSQAATVMLVAGILPVMITSLPTIASLCGNGTVAAFAAFSLAGLIAGHLLGGPHASDRRMLALATAYRHPGVALAILGGIFSEPKLVQAAVLCYMIVCGILCALYLVWRVRRDTKAPATAIN
jgi:BASS family bile acid:Na+ symporter